MNSDQVGYGSPPKQHQFKKGQSGNPRGRPKKSLNRRTVLVQTLNNYVLAESGRRTWVDEGDRSLEMSRLAATVRLIGDKAVQGDRHYVKLFLNLAAAAQKEKSRHHATLPEEAIAYKAEWEKEIAQCAKQGLPIPEPLPHPDDILIDFNTGDVTIVGPKTNEEKAAVDRAVRSRDRLIGYLETPNHLAATAPALRQALRARQIREIERINNLLPPRLRHTYEASVEPPI